MATARCIIDRRPFGRTFPANWGWFLALGVALPRPPGIAFGNGSVLATVVSVFYVRPDDAFIGSAMEIVHAFGVKPGAASSRNHKAACFIRRRACNLHQSGAGGRCP